MTEHTVGRQESDVGILTEKLEASLKLVFNYPDISSIDVTPPSGDEWKMHMPMLTEITSYGDKKLNKISIFKLGYFQSVTLSFDDYAQRVVFYKSDDAIDFVGPFESGNLYRVKRELERDISRDSRRLKAFIEVLEYCLLIRKMNQLPEKTEL